jgi:SAM-dependent methyltransferase
MSKAGQDMGKTKPWHEEDDFWERARAVLFPERRWEEAPLEVEAILSLVRPAPGARVLDLCCGPGRHALEFVRRGFQVTAVDRTTAYLESARRRAKKEGLDLEFIEDDMRSFCRPGGFDAVVNYFTSFGYFEDPEDDRRVVSNVYRSLKIGGAFLLDMMGKEVLARILQGRRWEEEDGWLLLQETRVTKNWSWVESRWIVLKDDKKQEFNISHRLYSAVELISLLTQCGFESVDIYGDVKGGPYDHTAQRLVAVAHKGEFG